MTNIINEKCSLLREDGRKLYKGEHHKTLLLTMFLFTLLCNIAPLVPFAGGIWAIIAAGPLALGISLVYLNCFDGTYGGENLFEGFKNFGKALGLYWFIFLFVFLWTLLFVFPGIIAAYRYSQSYYIMKERPELTIRECVNESKRMMDGNKGKLFLLDLSFIGWWLLLSLVVSVIGGAVLLITTPDALSMTTEELNSTFCMQTLVPVIAVLLSVPLEAYIFSSHTCFYKRLTGEIREEERPADDIVPMDEPIVKEEVKEDIEAGETIAEDIQ